MVIFLLAAFISPAAGEALRPQLVLAQRQKEPTAKPPTDDFDLLPKEAAPDAAALARQQKLERKLAQRRTMLQFHQLAGFLTLASLTTTVVLGQLDYLDKYGGRGGTGTLPPLRHAGGVRRPRAFPRPRSRARCRPVRLR